MFANGQKGAYMSTVMQFYRSFCESLLRYGLAVTYSASSKKLLIKCQKVQNRILRSVLGLRMCVCNDILFDLSEMINVDDLHRVECVNTAVMLIQSGIVGVEQIPYLSSK